MIFEQVVTAYCRGDKAALAVLLSPKLFEQWSKSIDARLNDRERLSVVIVQMRQPEIVHTVHDSLRTQVVVLFNVDMFVTASSARKEAKTVRYWAQDVWTLSKAGSDQNWSVDETQTCADFEDCRALLVNAR